MGKYVNNHLSKIETVNVDQTVMGRISLSGIMLKIM
jgi:hypothetical protein